MEKHSVDIATAFFMLYKEGKSIYEALPTTEKKLFEEKAKAAKEKLQADFKAWKEKQGRSNDAPKRPLGAYAQWIKDNRPMLIEKIMAKHGV